MSRLRWGDDVPADAAAARQRLVDAARVCVDRYGLAKTTIEDIAGEAKVSRATIYRYFANRDELVLAVLLGSLARSMERSLGSFFVGAGTPERFGQALVDSAVYLLAAIRHDPLLEILLSRETGGISATISGASTLLFRTVLDEWRTPLTSAQMAGLIRPEVAIDELSEWILRVILSLVTVEGPEPHAPDEERRLIRTFLVPAVVAAGDRTAAAAG
jgi:AcrR family transcriptional regulator